MTRKKCSSLLPNGWINDEVINFYFQLLQKRDNALYQCIGYPKAKNFFFNSYFMNKLLDVGVSDKYNYSQVRKWTKQINIFTREKCFIPVNISLSPWTLIVIFMSTKKVIYYDSLPTRPTAENTYLQSVVTYLVQEGSEGIMPTTANQTVYSDWEQVTASCPQLSSAEQWK